MFWLDVASKERKREREVETISPPFNVLKMLHSLVIASPKFKEMNLQLDTTNILLDIKLHISMYITIMLLFMLYFKCNNLLTSLNNSNKLLIKYTNNRILYSNGSNIREGGF